MILEKYRPGRPALFVLSTPAPDAVATYYRAVLGWEAGPDGVLDLHGEPVARLSVGTGGWLPHLAVTGLDAALAEVRAAGGTATEPVDGPAGRTAVVLDPTSTPLGLWEDGSGPAVRRWAEAGAVTWVEQKTRDQAAATRFLSDVFGFAFVGPEGPGKVRVAQDGEPPFGGVMQFDDRWVPDEAAHWLVYVAVADLDATLARSEAAGGAVWFPPFDTPLGRMAYLRDPAGHGFAVVRLSR